MLVCLVGFSFLKPESDTLGDLVVLNCQTGLQSGSRKLCLYYEVVIWFGCWGAEAGKPACEFWEDFSDIKRKSPDSRQN